jgi:hypothetical protein
MREIVSSKPTKQRLLGFVVGVVAVVVAAAACDSVTPAPVETDASAPLISADGGQGGDRADRSCTIVLRDLARRADDRGGYQTQGGNWVWFGALDVARPALDAGARPAVIYRPNANEDWYEAPAAAAAGAPLGFERFAFRLAEHTSPMPSMSGSAIAAARMEVVPFLAMPDGSRVFDHNRNPGDFDNYVLAASNGFRVVDEPGACGVLPVQWAGDWGAGAPDWGTNTDPCALPAVGLLEPVPIYPWSIADRTCAFVSAEVYVPGLTDLRGDPARLLAEAEWSVDGGALRRTTLGYAGTHGSNFIYLWNVQREAFGSDWRKVAFAFRFSTDGAEWFRIGLAPGPDGGDPRTLRVVDAPGSVTGFVTKITRDDGDPCSGGQPVEEGFLYGTFARQRATTRNLCFEVWKPGVTDWDNPDVWRQLDVAIYHRFGDGAWARTYVDFERRVGNNARYVVDLARLDPFRPLTCPTVPTTLNSGLGEQYLDASLAFYLAVNGVPFPALGAFHGTFEDYAVDAWRQQSCPP